MEEAKQNKERKKSEWKTLLVAFINNLTQQASKTIAELTKFSINQIKEEKSKIVSYVKQKIASAIFLTIGIIFLSLGLALLINEFLATRNSLGYIIVGLILLIVGLVMPRKRTSP